MQLTDMAIRVLFPHALDSYVLSRSSPGTASMSRSHVLM
jgi:hypothetical protein